MSLQPVPTKDTRLLNAIKDRWKRFGYGPSVRELQADCEISSTSVVMYHLKRLEAAGRIVRDPSVARSIRVVR